MWVLGALLLLHPNAGGAFLLNTDATTAALNILQSLTNNPSHYDQGERFKRSRSGWDKEFHLQQFGLTGRVKFIDENVPLKGGRAELEFEDFEKVVSSTILKNDSQPKSGNPKDNNDAGIDEEMHDIEDSIIEPTMKLRLPKHVKLIITLDNLEKLTDDLIEINMEVIADGVEHEFVVYRKKSFLDTGFYGWETFFETSLGHKISMKSDQKNILIVEYKDNTYGLFKVNGTLEEPRGAKVDVFQDGINIYGLAVKWGSDTPLFNATLKDATGNNVADIGITFGPRNFNVRAETILFKNWGSVLLSIGLEHDISQAKISTWAICSKNDATMFNITFDSNINAAGTFKAEGNLINKYGAQSRILVTVNNIGNSIVEPSEATLSLTLNNMDFVEINNTMTYNLYHNSGKLDSRGKIRYLGGEGAFAGRDLLLTATLKYGNEEYEYDEYDSDEKPEEDVTASIVLSHLQEKIIEMTLSGESTGYNLIITAPKPFSFFAVGKSELLFQILTKTSSWNYLPQKITITTDDILFPKIVYEQKNHRNRKVIHKINIADEYAAEFGFWYQEFFSSIAKNDKNITLLLYHGEPIKKLDISARESAENNVKVNVYLKNHDEESFCDLDMSGSLGGPRFAIVQRLDWDNKDKIVFANKQRYSTEDDGQYLFTFQVFKSRWTKEGKLSFADDENKIELTYTENDGYNIHHKTMARRALTAMERENNNSILKEYGIDESNVNHRDHSGNQLIHQSWDEWNDKVLKALIANGLVWDFEVPGQYRNTPLHENAYNDRAALRILIDNGGDVNARNPRDGTTPLHKATTNGKLEVIDYLLGVGANIEARSEGGNTALHSASFACNRGSIRKLMRHGADRRARNNWGKTPLDAALAVGCPGLRNEFRR